MSANNLIVINKKTFVVKVEDVESGYGSVVGKGENLEAAIEIAEQYMAKEIVEYGIHFVIA